MLTSKWGVLTVKEPLQTLSSVLKYLNLNVQETKQVGALHICITMKPHSVTT